jgi:hypothetical protein
MKKLIFSVALIFIGACFGSAITYAVWSNFMEHSINARFLGDSSQDLTMVETLESEKFDLGLSLSKMRLSSSLIGLSSTYKSLKPAEKNKADRLFEKAKVLEVDVPAEAQ